jgi:outer membrane murein-binding lipoprotein Lpp
MSGEHSGEERGAQPPDLAAQIAALESDVRVLKSQVAAIEEAFTGASLDGLKIDLARISGEIGLPPSSTAPSLQAAVADLQAAIGQLRLQLPAAIESAIEAANAQPKAPDSTAADLAKLLAVFKKRFPFDI